MYAHTACDIPLSKLPDTNEICYVCVGGVSNAQQALQTYNLDGATSWCVALWKHKPETLSLQISCLLRQALRGGRVLIVAEDEGLRGRHAHQRGHHEALPYGTHLSCQAHGITVLT